MWAVERQYDTILHINHPSRGERDVGTLKCVLLYMSNRINELMNENHICIALFARETR